MAKKNTKNQKSEKSQKTNKIVKMVVIIVLTVCVVAGGITTIVSTVKRKNAEKTVRIAFYGLSEEYVSILKEKIPVEDKIILKMDVLSEGAIDLAAVKEKYDMLFTWKGEVTDALEASSEDIPAKIVECMPSSLRNKKCVPILLDHCELDYSKDVVSKTTENIPSSFPSFLNYLNQAKNHVFSPFFCAGADDRILTAFVGSLLESMGGIKAYKNFITELKNGTDFEELLDKDLGSPNVTLRSVLDMLKSWPKEGLTHPAWFNGQNNDLIYFADDNHVGVFFTYLKDHRNIQYQTISKYESFVVPPASSTIEYGIIAPAISCMLLTNNSNCKRYLAEFFTEDSQAELSNLTKLAPVHSRAQAYDRQADDVRFWAASCPGGALPDIYLAVYQRNPTAFAEFARNIRNYVK
jgi:Flp pilus assembly pilin Flp